MTTVKTGDTIRVSFTARVERTGDDGCGNRHVFAGRMWLGPGQYEVVEESQHG